MNEQAKKRREVLEILYRAREKNPRTGWVSEYDLKNAVGDVGFAVAILEEMGGIQRNGNLYRIAGHGVTRVEEA